MSNKITPAEIDAFITRCAARNDRVEGMGLPTLARWGQPNTGTISANANALYLADLFNARTASALWDAWCWVNG